MSTVKECDYKNLALAAIRSSRVATPSRSRVVSAAPTYVHVPIPRSSGLYEYSVCGVLSC